MKVLHILHWLNRGGAENWLMTILREIRSTPNLQSSLSFDVLCKGAFTGEMSEEARALGANIFHLPQGKIGYFSPQYKTEVERFLLRGKYSVVHSHLGDLSGPYVEAAKAAKVPVRVVTYHSIRHQLSRTSVPVLSAIPGAEWLFEWFQAHERRRVANSANRIVGCSYSVINEHFQNWKSLDRFSVLPPPVDATRFNAATPVPFPNESVFLGSANSFKIINVGNLDSSKNQKVIPEVALKLRQHGIDCVFYIVGRGSLESELQRRIDQNGLTGRVVLLGPRNDVPGLLRSASMAFHPSVVEGFPVSVLEYQAAGLPVCGSDIGPMREACAPGNLSLLARPDDISAHVQAIESLIKSKSKLREASNTARSWAQENFQVSSHIDKLIRIYSETNDRA